jgi:hypothetical protein
MKFDWNRARAFLVTAEEGSLSAAARALGMAQPTLGRQVARRWSRSLAWRCSSGPGAGLVMTPSGLELMDHVRAMGEAAAERMSLCGLGQGAGDRGHGVDQRQRGGCGFPAAADHPPDQGSCAGHRCRDRRDQYRKRSQAARGRHRHPQLPADAAQSGGAQDPRYSWPDLCDARLSREHRQSVHAGGLCGRPISSDSTGPENSSRP